VGFVRKWFKRPLRPRDGVEPLQLAVFEEELALPLPQAVREFYLLAGNRVRSWKGLNTLYTLDELSGSGALMLGAAHQGVLVWNVAKRQRSEPDPLVGDERRGLCRASDFYLSFLIEQVARLYAIRPAGLGRAVRRGWHSSLGSDPERISDYYAKLPLGCFSTAIHGDADTVLVVSGDEVWVAARTRAAWRKVEERYGEDPCFWTSE